MNKRERKVERILLSAVIFISGASMIFRHFFYGKMTESYGLIMGIVFVLISFILFLRRKNVQ